MSDLVGNPEDGFSRVAAPILASNSSNFWRCRGSGIPTELLAGTADAEKKEKLLI